MAQEQLCKQKRQQQRESTQGKNPNKKSAPKPSCEVLEYVRTYGTYSSTYASRKDETHVGHDQPASVWDTALLWDLTSLVVTSGRHHRLFARDERPVRVSARRSYSSTRTNVCLSFVCSSFVCSLLACGAAFGW